MNDYIIETGPPLPSPKLRSSERTERARLLTQIDDVSAKLADSNEKFELSGDSLHYRQARSYEKELATAQAKLERFDAGVSKGHEAAESPEAETARKAFEKRLKAWEKKLTAFAKDSTELLAAAEAYTRASGVTEPARFPGRHVVKPGISRRTHYVLNGAGLKFEQYAPNSSENLTAKWCG